VLKEAKNALVSSLVASSKAGVGDLGVEDGEGEGELPVPVSTAVRLPFFPIKQCSLQGRTVHPSQHEG
jgi:hypothetical protein